MTRDGRFSAGNPSSPDIHRCSWYQFWDSEFTPLVKQGGRVTTHPLSRAALPENCTFYAISCMSHEATARPSHALFWVFLKAKVLFRTFAEMRC